MSIKKLRGRPKKDDRKEYRFEMRLTKEEYEDLIFLSRMSHLNKAEYVKAAIISKNAETRDVLGIREVEEHEYYDEPTYEDDDYDWVD